MQQQASTQFPKVIHDEEEHKRLIPELVEKTRDLSLMWTMPISSADYSSPTDSNSVFGAFPKRKKTKILPNQTWSLFERKA